MISSASKSISLAARAAAVLSVFLLAPPLAAQTSFSTVRGTATDQTGAIVPGVNVTVTVKTYQESPQSGIDRFNPTMLLMMLPSVQPTVGGGNDFSISGVGGSQIEEGMDGAVTQGSVNQIHNMEDVEEVKVVTINNSAEYPRAGYFNLVGKRGYNAFHGTAVYYFQNSALNARSFFDPERAPLKFHIFGASAS